MIGIPKQMINKDQLQAVRYKNARGKTENTVFKENVVIQLFENRPNKKDETTGEQCNSYIQTTIFL